MTDVPSLYKYMPYRKEFFENFYLRCTPRSALNDPFEMLPSEQYIGNEMDDRGVTGEKATERHTSSFKSYLASHGVVSFSLSCEPNNPLMWAHYAAAHEGISVELDKSIIEHAWRSPMSGHFIGDLLAEDNYIIREVTYSKDRLKKSPWIFKPGELPQEDYKCVYFHKNESWSYENEWRLLTRLDRTSQVICDEDFFKQHFESHIELNENIETSDGTQVPKDNKAKLKKSFTPIVSANRTYLNALSDPKVLCIFL